MAKFLGFQQVLKSEYESKTRAEKLNYMWLVREADDSGNTITASIYFGTREYANLGADGNAITRNNITSVIPDLVDNGDGTFSIDYDKLASNLDYTKIPELSEITERVDTVYEAIFPSGKTEDNLVTRVEALEDFKDKAENKLLPMEIDITDDSEELS